MSDELPIRGQPPSPEELFWRQTIQEIRKGSVERVEKAAREVIALVTLLSGLYFNAIAFGQVPKGWVLLLGPLRPNLKFLFVGPLVLWTFCLVAAILVLLPRRLEVQPYVPAEIEQFVLGVLRWKYRWLTAALLLLGLSLAWLVVAAWVYLDVYVTAPP